MIHLKCQGLLLISLNESNNNNNNNNNNKHQQQNLESRLLQFKC